MAAIAILPVPSEEIVAPPISNVSAERNAVDHLLDDEPNWKTPSALGIKLPATCTPALESSVDIVVPATLIPSITTFPLLDVNVRSALLGAAMVEPTNERSPIDTFATSLSTYALIDCCVANAVLLSLLRLSSSKIAVTVAPLASANDVDVDNAPSTFAVPSTFSPSFTFTVALSSALIVVPLNLNADATTPPVPPGVSVRSALLGVLIVDPVIVRSPVDAETVPKDKTPDPFVCKTWFALPSDEGSV